MELDRQEITFEQMKSIIEENLAYLLDKRKTALIIEPDITIAICNCVQTLITLEEKSRNRR